MENWTPAPDRPGYRCKTVQHGAATIVIYRPILDEEQQAKANKRTSAELESALRGYCRRTANRAAV